MPLSSKRGREICFVVRKLIFCCMRENQRVDTLSERSLATNVIGFLIVVDPFSYIRTDVTGKCLCLGCYHVKVCSTWMWCWCNILFRTVEGGPNYLCGPNTFLEGTSVLYAVIFITGALICRFHRRKLRARLALVLTLAMCLFHRRSDVSVTLRC